MATTHVVVVSPAGILNESEPEMVVARTDGGEIAFLADHTAYLGSLEPCVVRLVSGSHADEVKIAVSGGFVEVRDNYVNILADAALLADDIDVQAAQADQHSAEERLRADPADKTAEADLAWAQARQTVVAG